MFVESFMKNIAKRLFFVSLLFAVVQANAAQNTSLYDVEVLVVNEAGDTRWRAFKEGMDEVFIRIAGDSIVMDKLKAPPASRYVKRFSYSPVENPVLNEEGEALSYRLKIQYNGSLMEKYLLDNGFPVWGEHRPDVVIWLAVRDGRNEYVLKDSDQSLLKTTADEALQRRGVPERWPLYDFKDRKILTFADIRGGFKDPVNTASKRYSRGPALTGSLIWNGAEWQSSWGLVMETGNRHWSLVDADYNQLINKAIDQAADALGLVFAIHNTANKQQLATIRLDIQAINSIEKYRHVENYLSGLNAVEMARPLQVDGMKALFEVTLRSNEEDFLNLIKNDAELVKVTAPEIMEVEVIEQEVKTPEMNIQPVSEKTTSTDKSIKVVPEIATEELKVKDDTLLSENQVPVYYYKLIK